MVDVVAAVVVDGVEAVPVEALAPHATSKSGLAPRMRCPQLRFFKRANTGSCPNSFMAAMVTRRCCSVSAGHLTAARSAPEDAGLLQFGDLFGCVAELIEDRVGVLADGATFHRAA